jgi:hypothetical protein
VYNPATMRALLRYSSALILALAACGSDSGGGADASVVDAVANPDVRMYDANPNPFYCNGQPQPTTAPAMVTISGSIQEIANLSTEPLPGSTIKAYKTSDDTQVGMSTSDANGSWSMSLPTGGVPLEGYLVGHHDPVTKPNNTVSTYIDTYLYSPYALAADNGQGVILMLTSGDMGTLHLLAQLAGTTQQAGKGMVGLVVADCNGKALKGAVVTSEPAATPIYDNGSIPDTTATATGTDGRAYLFNLPAGDVTVHATYNGMTFYAHAVKARADVVTTTAIEP